MSKSKAKGPQLSTIPRYVELPDVNFNLQAQDLFIKNNSVIFRHEKAIPSPIGLKSLGDYRRPDELDTTSSNGFIYKSVGCFAGVMLGNTRNRNDNEGGVMDPSQCRITLPRFYNSEDGGDSENRIYMAPGDRIFVAGDADTCVDHFQRMQFQGGNRDDMAQFPIIKTQFLIGSDGKEYFQDRDFKITSDGNIRWISGKNCPGIDPDTGQGRIYSVRFTYEAHWYITQILNEVRIGNITEGDIRKEARMPYHVIAVREYVYHNRQNGKETQPIQKYIKNEKQDRTSPEPNTDILPNSPHIKVDMSEVDED